MWDKICCEREQSVLTDTGGLWFKVISCNYGCHNGVVGGGTSRDLSWWKDIRSLEVVHGRRAMDF